MQTQEAPKIIPQLIKLDACGEALEWCRTQEGPEEAWKNCHRGDWMLWLLGTFSGEPGSEERKPLVLCACECARLALKYVKPGEERPLKAIETAEAWARNEGPTLQDVRAAAAYADAAYAAAYAAYAAYAAAYAAYAADAYAAYAADAYAADAAAAYAAYAADAAAAYAAYAAYARKETLQQCADIVRKHYPAAPINKLFTYMRRVG